MAKEQYFNNEEENDNIDFQEILFKYLAYWKWIVGSVIVCLIGAFIYLKCTAPVYNISSTILLKDDKKGGGVDELSTLQDWGVLNSKNNVDNEIEVLQSKNLLKSVVNELKLHTMYTLKSHIPSRQLYNSSPILAEMNKDSLDVLVYPVFMEVKMSEDGRVIVKGESDEEEFEATFPKLPAVLKVPGGTVTFTVNPQVNPIYDENISITIVNPLTIARNYARSLSVAPTSKTTSVVTLSLPETNQRRGKDFLNKLVDVYNKDAVEDKNRVALNTEAFIDARLAKLDIELGTAERDLEQYKKKEKITDIQADAELALQENSGYQKKRVEVETQLGMVKYLRDYMQDDKDRTKLMPANVGITDPTLQALSTKYNAYLLERDRLLRTSSHQNPAVQSLNNTIEAMYESILASLNSVYQGLLISKSDLDKQTKIFDTRISNVPTMEREYTEKARQQQIKSELFLILLQKREENSLALSITTNSAKIIDDAYASGPVSPKRSLIFMVAFVLGLAIPIGFVYIRDLLNFKIQNRSELEKLTNVSVLGEIPVGEENERIAVKENVNDGMAEAFRAVRANLQFMLANTDHKVIMVTSSVPTEGKSFIAINLAASLALMGKKVLLVGLDVRKPTLAAYMSIDKTSGATNYLANIESDLSKLIRPSKFNSHLDVMPAGPIPPNPAELLLSPRMDEMFAILRHEYDYIIVDTAPVGLVSDSLTVGRVADATVYVARANVTYKKYMDWLNDLHNTNKLPNVSVLLNGVPFGKSGYYGYGYGYGHGYGYGYGGYGDGDKTHHHKKK